MDTMKKDVCVVGGGMAGIAAAVTAARQGARVALVQNRSALGGNASSEIRVHVCGADNHGHKPFLRETGILEDIRLENLYGNPQRSYPVWDLILYDYVTREPNVDLLLNTACVGARMDGPRVAAALVEQTVNWRRFEIAAPVFIDASGDGRLAFEAGAEYRRGMEASSEYGESAAPETANEFNMGSSLLYEVVDLGRPVPYAPPVWAYDYKVKGLPAHRRPSTGQLSGYWWVEYGGMLHPTEDGEEVRRELMRIMLGIWDYVKNSGEFPEAANLAMSWAGQLPGRRSGLRFLGDHVLCQRDLERFADFPDAVAYGGWPMDRHPCEGFYAENPPAINIHMPDAYSIPLGSLYSRNVENLYLAGRCHSATYMAHSSTRVMGTGMSMGQAVGMAAAVGLERAADARRVREHFVGEVQQRLLKEDVFIPGVRNEDPADVARTARVTASSAESPELGPENAVSGVARPRGETPHRWASAPGRAAGEWIRFEWGRAHTVSEVRLTFDTNLRPQFTFSIFPYVKQPLTAPIPETVRDYRVEVREGHDWRAVAEVTGNFRRHRVHRFEPVATDAVRLVIDATNGAEQALLYEARIY